MQIQRIQTLFLLIAAIFTGVFCFLPYAVIQTGDAPAAQVLVSDTPVLLVLNILITVLLLIDIFLYNNLKLQITVCAVDIFLLLGSLIATFAYIFIAQPGATPVFCGGFFMILIAEGFTLAARRAMKNDLRRLRAADRIR